MDIIKLIMVYLPHRYDMVLNSPVVVADIKLILLYNDLMHWLSNES